MGKTSIEWADMVWNPTTGCTKISPGCAHCYAERIARRFWGKRDFDDLKFHPERLEFPLKVKKPQRIFVDSMSDLFHPAFTDELIYRVFKVMSMAYWHIFQVLTKRPLRMAEIVPRIRNMLPDRLNNIWLGVSIENQKTANERLPLLMDTPAAVKFVSCEPLLEYVDLVKAVQPSEWAWDEVNADPDDCEPEEIIEECEAECDWINYGDDLVVNPEYQEWEQQRIRQAQSITFKQGINWVICGGETGPGARPMHIEWARGLKDQCKGAEIAFFFKSWGEFRPCMIMDDDVVGLPLILASGLETMARVGRRKSGRLLEGVEWSEFPAGQ